MAIITISRGSFSGGKMLAECLARKLGYRCVDRDLIVQRAAQYGVSEKELRAAMDQPPSFLGQSKHARYVYLAVIQAALAEEAWNGKAVYHGLAGHLLLKDMPCMLRVRIIAPMDFRIRMVQERLKVGHKEALVYIEKVDRDRRNWTQFLYGVEWADPALYDVVLNLEHMNVEQACDAVCAMTQQKWLEFTSEAEQAMEDLVTASRVRAGLAIDPATGDLELHVTAHQGAVSVRGELLRMNQGKEITRVARAVPGVKSIKLAELALAASF